MSCKVVWYTGHDSSTGVKRHRIGYATSPDGIIWTECNDNPILDSGAGEAGAWDCSRVNGPCVIVDDSGYRMEYHDFDGWHWRIGYAANFNNGGNFAVKPQGKLTKTWADVKRVVVSQK